MICRTVNRFFLTHITYLTGYSDFPMISTRRVACVDGLSSVVEQSYRRRLIVNRFALHLLTVFTVFTIASLIGVGSTPRASSAQAGTLAATESSPSAGT